MLIASSTLGIDLENAELVELAVCDVSLARALYEGSPAARLLARTRLASDERDLGPNVAHEEPTSTWDGVLCALTQNRHHVASLDRIKRAVARHTRAASVEGALVAAPAVVAALMLAVAATDDADASLAEIATGALVAGGAIVEAVAARAVAYDLRLADRTIDARGPLFEVCIRLAARATAGPWAGAAVLDAFRMLAELAGDTPVRPPSATPLFPREVDATFPPLSRTVARIDRTELDVVVARDPRALGGAISRCDESRRGHLDTFVADLTKLLTANGPLVVAVAPRAAKADAAALDTAAGTDSSANANANAGEPPRRAPPSWIPQSWAANDTAVTLAEAVERGTTTLPRLRLAVLRGGDLALDAVGAEMLQASAHPFASAAFAELLARSGRPRDIIRLVTYFAIAPDPSLAARALGACAAPELPRVLAAWLEAMLPSDGEPAPLGSDPETSCAARLTACISSLAPYPHLHRAVAPLMQRVSYAPQVGEESGAVPDSYSRRG